jgi:di/tricarboxylate transporter
MVELITAPHVGLSGKSLRDFSFREKYGMNVLGVWREGKPILEDVADLPLHVGDALLVQGTVSQISRVKDDRFFLLLEEDPEAVQAPQKAGLALLITIITITIAAFNILPISLTMLAGAALMLLTRCANFDEVYRTINWKVIFLIAGLWPLSIVVRTSGLSDFIVQAAYTAADGITPLGFAVILIGLGLILTQVIGGQVTALIITPIAIGAAKLLGIDPRGLTMAAALSCSLAFIVPYGHPVNLIVLSSGGYKSKDFIRVGLPLTILVIATILIGLRIFWGV